jgi:hypothetical protein
MPTIGARGTLHELHLLERSGAIAAFPSLEVYRDIVD